MFVFFKTQRDFQKCSESAQIDAPRNSQWFIALSILKCGVFDGIFFSIWRVGVCKYADECDESVGNDGSLFWFGGNIVEWMAEEGDGCEFFNLFRTWIYVNRRFLKNNVSWK